MCDECVTMKQGVNEETFQCLGTNGGRCHPALCFPFDHCFLIRQCM